jgi:cyanophycinase-like exopeptidase
VLGVVLCGGSAGAICWFESGPSDSKDPTTFRFPRSDMTEEEKRNWKYINVSGLGFVRGMCCPHHDITQSNGMPRSGVFDDMLLKHPGEVGIGIDDHGAILIDGNRWRVLKADDNSKVCLKHVTDNGTVEATLYTASDKWHSTDLFGQRPSSGTKRRRT